jgi:hypothetical protein
MCTPLRARSRGNWRGPRGYRDERPGNAQVSVPQGEAAPVYAIFQASDGSGRARAVPGPSKVSQRRPTTTEAHGI